MAGRSRRKLWIVLGGLVLLLALVLLVVPRLIDVERHRARVEQVLAEATGWEAELGAIRLSLLGGVALRVAPARLAAPDASSSIAVENLDVRVALWPLLSGRVEVRRIDVAGATLEIVRPSVERGWVLPPLPVGEGAAGGDGSGGGPSRVSIGELRIEDSVAVLSDRAEAPGFTLRLEDLAANVSVASGEIEGRCRIGEGPGKLSWQGTLAQGLAFVLEDVPSETLAPWLGSELVRPGGGFAGDVTLRLPLQLTGRLEASNLTLLSGTRPFEQARVAFDVVVEGATYRLASFEFEGRGARLTGGGTLLPDLALDLALPQIPIETALDASESVLPLPLRLSPPGRFEMRLLVDRPAGGELGYEARGQLSAARFDLGSPLPPATDVAADFVLDRRGALEVRLREGEIGGGALEGVARLDSVDPPGTLRFDGGLRNAALGDLIAGIVPGAAERVAGDVRGQARVGLDLGGGVTSLAALGGTLELDASRVGLPGWDLEAALLGKLQEKIGSLGRIAELLGRSPASEAAAAEARTEKPLIDLLAARLDFDARPWKLETLRLVAGSFAAAGSGAFDPQTGAVQLDFTARLGAERSAGLVQKYSALRKLLDAEGRLTVPLRLSGPLLSPQVGVDLDSLLLGGASREDAVRGVLEKLLKKKDGERRE